MCVIIDIPKGKRLEESELNAAWKRNKHGAGFMYQKDNKVYYERGFMTLEEYKEKIKPIMGKYRLVLHLRISTSNAVNKLQTHPYEVGNITNQKGCTTNPVTCMNGTVKSSDLEMIKECNDTMSYIVQNQTLFMEFIDKQVTNKEKEKLTEFIKKDTSAKWCIMTPTDVFLTSGFTQKGGIKFSNLLHNSYKVYNSFFDYKDTITGIRNVIKRPKLRRKLYKDNWDLYLDIEDYTEEYCDNCNSQYIGCKGCLKLCRSIQDIEKFRKDNQIKFEELFCIGYNYDINEEEKDNSYNKDYYDYCDCCDYDDYKYNENYNLFDE